MTQLVKNRLLNRITIERTVVVVTPCKLDVDPPADETDDEVATLKSEDEAVVEETGELVDDEGDDEAVLELGLGVEDPGLLLDDELVVDGPGAEDELTV